MRMQTRSGIDVERSTIRCRSSPPTARSRPRSVIIDALSVGPIERRDVPALVAPPGSLDQSLLGMSFLDTLDSYTISGDRRLTLSP